MSGYHHCRALPRNATHTRWRSQCSCGWHSPWYATPYRAALSWVAHWRGQLLLK